MQRTPTSRKSGSNAPYRSTTFDGAPLRWMEDLETPCCLLDRNYVRIEHSPTWVRPRSRNGWRRLCASWVPTAPKAQGRGAMMGQSRAVLIVEDDAELRSLMATLL